VRFAGKTLREEHFFPPFPPFEQCQVSTRSFVFSDSDDTSKQIRFKATTIDGTVVQAFWPRFLAMGKTGEVRITNATFPLLTTALHTHHPS
jgi:hypothetical protein